MGMGGGDVERGRAQQIGRAVFAAVRIPAESPLRGSEIPPTLVSTPKKKKT